MFRILGFVVGSIASIAALVLMVGMPSFHLNGDAAEEDRFDVVIQQLKQKQQNPDRSEAAGGEFLDEKPDPDANTSIAEAPRPGADESPDDLAEPAKPESAPQPAQLADAMPLTEAPDNPVPGNADAADDRVDRSVPFDQPAEVTLTDAQQPTESGWQSFWNPFRSEIAAKGFVRRLENVTGLDYRVVKIKNGVYEVAFSYNDDAERSSKLTQIAAATGLDLSDVGQ